jgi:hypothetical protein
VCRPVNVFQYSRAVMPVQTGIQEGFLDSGVRRNDDYLGNLLAGHHTRSNETDHRGFDTEISTIPANILGGLAKKEARTPIVISI